jgi:hypothetical protein
MGTRLGLLGGALAIAAIGMGLVGCSTTASYPTLPGISANSQDAMGQKTLTPAEQQDTIKALTSALAGQQGGIQPAVMKSSTPSE